MGERDPSNPGFLGPATDLEDRSMAVFSRDVQSASDARAWLGSFLHRHHVDGRYCEDAILVVSELVTNALLHGAGATVLRVRISPESLLLAVTDSADGLPAVLNREPDTIGGLGLVIVTRLSQDWGVTPFPGGKTVWATLARSA